VFVAREVNGRKVIRTRERVAALLEGGMGRLEVARTLGLSKSTVSYHARRLGLPVDERCNRRYDWSAVQRFYDEGHSVSQCQARFGFSRETWNAARRRGAVVPRPHAMPLEQLLGAPRNRGHLKRRLIKLGLKEARCEICGISRWRERPLALALHHVNGNKHDNRLENLRLLCPNCHSQTENFAGRNGRRGGGGFRAGGGSLRRWRGVRPRRGAWAFASACDSKYGRDRTCGWAWLAVDAG
jgi:5-methylcytosine-specific restriction endonuclease McrA